MLIRKTPFPGWFQNVWFQTVFSAWTHWFMLLSGRVYAKCCVEVFLSKPGSKSPNTMYTFSITSISRFSCLPSSIFQLKNYLLSIYKLRDRADTKRASVGLLTHSVDFWRTLDAKISLWLRNSETISEVATTIKCRPLELFTSVRNTFLNEKQSL